MKMNVNRRKEVNNIKRQFKIGDRVESNKDYNKLFKSSIKGTVIGYYCDRFNELLSGVIISNNSENILYISDTWICKVVDSKQINRKYRRKQIEKSMSRLRHTSNKRNAD